MKKLSPAEIATSLKTISPKWNLQEDKIQREFIFKDFVEAFEFMTKVAAKAQELNHHPEWSNVYHKVNVQLITHEVKGLSELDFRLARYLEEVSTHAAG